MGTPSHNDSPVTVGSFTDVKVSQADVVYAKDHYPLEYTCFWCGGTAFFVVSRTSVLTGRVFSDHACTECSRKWVSPSSEQKAINAKARWARMKPGHKEQFRERVSEARRDITAKQTLEDRRKMTAAARLKRLGQRT